MLLGSMELRLTTFYLSILLYILKSSLSLYAFLALYALVWQRFAPRFCFLKPCLMVSIILLFSESRDKGHRWGCHYERPHPLHGIILNKGKLPLQTMCPRCQHQAQSKRNSSQVLLKFIKYLLEYLRFYSSLLVGMELSAWHAHKKISHSEGITITSDIIVNPHLLLMNDNGQLIDWTMRKVEDHLRYKREMLLPLLIVVAWVCHHESQRPSVGLYLCSCPFAGCIIVLALFSKLTWSNQQLGLLLDAELGQYVLWKLHSCKLF